VGSRVMKREKEGGGNRVMMECGEKGELLY
jgi:hypothetical protein